MSEEYNELMNKYKDYIDLTDAIYRLKTLDEDKINEIYKNIKSQFIEKGIMTALQTFKMIDTAMKYNNRYFKSYFLLLQMLSKEYHLNKDKLLNWYQGKYKKINIESKNSLLGAIMNDDITKFVILAEKDDFDIDQEVICSIYPLCCMTLLELCSYYGSVNCFKFLLTNFKSKILKHCTPCAFLGANPDIISKCLEDRVGDYDMMEFAIASHNIDFVSYMMNECGIEFKLIESGRFNNLHAFLVYYDQTKDINGCMAASSLFNIPSLCEYFISKGADINANYYSFTALHLAAEEDCSKAAEFLISKGISMELICQSAYTPLDVAAKNNSVETMRVLLLHGANVNSRTDFDYGRTALHYAASHHNQEAFDILVSFGADLNVRDGFGKLPHMY
ncbi:hypothetical protein TVAG_197200 [Trichomonas vaginalis G3]|uniref:DUF3447 domain-containing protein n=1 Tax=Trichomonas vaginalis (strain ATCC PRA-98 / G3) TaxID=412133 RepID=A2EPJ0_TRIV3|nr:protein of unknown function (DUF3447) [Trichomonas vaginalis G3]EAY05419.1 hypothetical protein TVAG_197200 [Trichomonas vaginalis G3]KAI5523858.1 protein of unknown function (DUF3447) [Trichomonas vaginalis G3]|eukprot:XP_001317642.1 hypothetical protein [Trichomonas vaginalis G3]